MNLTEYFLRLLLVVPVVFALLQISERLEVIAKALVLLCNIERRRG